MAGFDDMIKGMQMLQDGIATYQTSQAVNAAADQLAAANKGLADDKVKFDNAQAIGQDLALRLSGIHGMTQDKIAGAVSGILPSASSQGQIMGQERMQSAKLAQEVSENDKDRKLKRDLFGMKSDKDAAKTDQMQQKRIMDRAQTFYKDNQKHIESIDKLAQLQKLIDTNPSQIGINLAKTALLREAGEDRVSNEDIIRGERDPSARQAIIRKMNLEFTGEALKDDRVFYSALLKGLRQGTKQRLRERVRGYADSIGEISQGAVSPDMLNSAISKRIPSLKNPNQAKIDEAKALLADPANANNPLRPKVEAELKRLETEAD